MQKNEESNKIYEKVSHNSSTDDSNSGTDDNKLANIDREQLLSNWRNIVNQIDNSSRKQSSESNPSSPSESQHNQLVQNHESMQNHQPVRLVAVSKTKPITMIETLASAGQVDFGENYLQEALPKIQALRASDIQHPICWHYIGHIQRNKTRDISENFDWVHTIERDIIAKRLNNQRPDDCPALNVLIQVNIDKEPNKSGCLPEDVESLVVKVATYERLNLRGLMIIPEKQSDDSENNAFKRTKTLFEQIKNEYPDLQHWDTLSMGMSGDMEEAIAHGSTMVRVGSAIFGARDTP